MLSKQNSLLEIMNCLNLPNSSKEELLSSYYLTLVAALNKKFSLTKEEFEQAVNDKKDILEVMNEKYPNFLEDEVMLLEIKEINGKFLNLLTSLADVQQREKIKDILKSSTV